MFIAPTLRQLIWCFITLALTTSPTDALLMSDLPTPSLVFDMQALQRYVDSSTGQKSSLIPPLALTNDTCVLYPFEAPKQISNEVDLKASPVRIGDAQTDEPFCFLHSSVLRSREQALEGQDDPVATFLAEVDCTKAECGDSGAELVLGLNNHHVGSYYWARSAGSGAAMEAPGVLFDRERGVLRWEKEGGPPECNSNDGKRSEWVNFLRTGDTVQLLPFDVEEAVKCVSASSDGKRWRIFGVSSKNRPLGSEPQVVCEWRLIQ